MPKSKPASLSGSCCNELTLNHLTWVWSYREEHSEISLDGATHIYDDAHRLVIGEENTHSAAVLHDFVVMEGQFVHCVVGRPVGGLGAPGAQQLLRLPALQSQLLLLIIRPMEASWCPTV